ncbi:Uncharacterized protein APZ42_030467 [Daphnia magna]|uniref:Uncharacterized protein n=1 Tax=Daphnia magna TaxID=35525 RepID=A0A164NQX4_9CRUS|nr:Uncharacterized protein APZ42_030467 [Daphnia magna]
MSGVIAGIMHHEKQQNDKIQVLEQKLSEALSELECTNKKRGSSQENDVTIAATDQYGKRRPGLDTPAEIRIGIEVSVGPETTVIPAYHVSEYHSSGRRDHNSSGYRPYKHKTHQRPRYRNGFNGRQENYNGPNYPSNNNYRHQVRYNSNQQQQNNPGKNPRTTENREITCYKSNRREHIARECWTVWHVPTTQVPIKHRKTNTKEMIALVDTGAAASLVSGKILDNLESNENLKQVESMNSPFFRTVSGQELKSIGKFELSVAIKDKISYLTMLTTEISQTKCG